RADDGRLAAVTLDRARKGAGLHRARGGDGDAAAAKRAGEVDPERDRIDDRDVHGEARPPARLAPGGDRSAQGLDDAPRDGEAEAGAAMAARGIAVALLELLEQAGDVVAPQPRPGIGDGEAQAPRSALAGGRHVDTHAA